MARRKVTSTEQPVSVRELIRRVWRAMDANNVTALAAQMSYYFGLALFPFLIFLAALVGGLPFTDVWDKVLRWITLHFPKESQGFILDTVASLTRGHRSFLSVGLLGMAWAACGGLMSLMQSLNTAYEAKETRSFAKRLGFSFVMLFVLAFLFLGSFRLLTIGDRLDAWLAAHMSPALPLLALWRVSRWVVSLALTGIGVAILDYTLPNLRRPWRWITPGCVFIVLGWVIATLGFDFYVRYIASYQKTYGALGAFVILMVWIYITSLVTLIGAEINSELRKVREEARPAVEKKVAHTSDF